MEAKASGMEGTISRRGFGIEDRFIQHGDHERLMADAGLQADQIAEAILPDLKED